MRPALLNPLFRHLDSLPGIGARVMVPLEKLVGGPTVWDMLCHRPTGLIDRRTITPVSDVKAGAIVTCDVVVDHHEPAPTSRRPYRVICHDEHGRLDIVFFRIKGDWAEKQLPVGARRIISGRADLYQGSPQIAHPDHIWPPDQFGREAALETVYPMVAGVNPKPLRRALLAALKDAPTLPEWANAPLVAREGWPSWRAALEALHHPGEPAELEPDTPTALRLAYDELLAGQLALALVRRDQRQRQGSERRATGRLRERLMSSLAFGLTGAQSRSLAEIDADMAAPRRMMRLLQGDVGSGKTIVAMLALLAAVESGAQGALMAPTELLARQHFAGFAPSLDLTGCRLEMLSGRDKGKARAEKLRALAAGEIDIIVGTHALFQDDVAFRDLGLVIVDEQHRFGVQQRFVLQQKGQRADVLVMTATPIPRTLALTQFGDLDVSRLDEKPPGRLPVKTVKIGLDRLDEVFDAVARKLAAGERIYWVTPLVEESDKLDVAAATARHDSLRERFGDQVGLVHGKMPAEEKDATMAAFQAGTIAVLVATTVIEVGVNVPEATVMIIEHAERFGLAQLHQLRGRVGRGSAASSCLLLYDPNAGETARQRLDTLRETEDGFIIAERDLALRGTGDVLGTKQSGLPRHRFADLTAHTELLRIAHDDARHVLETDPSLETERGQALRVLLYLFQRDDGIRLLRSG